VAVQEEPGADKTGAAVDHGSERLDGNQRLVVEPALVYRFLGPAAESEVTRRQEGPIQRMARGHQAPVTAAEADAGESSQTFAGRIGNQDGGQDDARR
jgi:hypothetical protein